MPLRDHFHPPLKARERWQPLHGIWPGQIVQLLFHRLPPRFYAVPKIHVGIQMEADVLAVEEAQAAGVTGASGNGSSVATAVWAPPQPTQTADADFAGQDLFEVEVRDEEEDARLVAVIELVSPRNKDRPAARRAFAVKCASLLQQNVAVLVVDVVTIRQHHLHGELMGLLSVHEPSPWREETTLYATSYRTIKTVDRWRLETWAQGLAIGSPLPTMPLWLSDDLAVPVELELSYEDACRLLRVS